MEYYSSLKKKTNNILPFATTWMGLKDTVLNEISQTEKRYCIISHIHRI